MSERDEELIKRFETPNLGLVRPIRKRHDGHWINSTLISCTQFSLETDVQELETACENTRSVDAILR